MAVPERPWAAYGRAMKPITDRQIAKLLAEYRIISGTVRIGDATAKGYQRGHFAGAWQRYIKPTSKPAGAENDQLPDAASDQGGKAPPLGPIPASQPSQRHNRNETWTSDDFSSVTETECDAREKRDFFIYDGHCDVVTVSSKELRRCNHCGRTGGDVQETHYGDDSALLHRDCQDAWKSAYDLDIRNQPSYRAGP